MSTPARLRPAILAAACLLAAAFGAHAEERPQCDAPGAPVALCRVIAPPGAAATRLHGVVVSLGGTVIAEQYFRGQDKIVGDLLAHDETFTAAGLHDMRSVSKSVVGLLVGAALRDGLIPSLDTPALDLLPAYAGYATPDKKRITVRHLLTMSAGLAWHEDGALSDETRMEFARNMPAYVLARPVAGPPGVRYAYNSGCTVLLGAILETVTGKRLDIYARETLFAPLGIDAFEWRAGRGGQILAHAGLRLRPRDLARIGVMLMDKGRWQGRQIMPAAYVADSMTGRLQAERDWRYGYQWRTGTAIAGGRAYSWSAAFGNGGQRLYLVPSLDLAVVITAGRYDAPYPANARPSDELFARIVATIAEPPR